MKVPPVKTLVMALAVGYLVLMLLGKAARPF